MQHRSPGDDEEQPTWLAEWKITTEPLAPSGQADIEQPTRFAEWVIVTEPLPPWDDLRDPGEPDPAR